MKNWLNWLSENLKLFGKTPEVFSLSAILVLGAVLVAVNIFFLPLPLKMASLPVFLVIALVAFSNRLKLTGLKMETELKTKELQTIIEEADDGFIIYDTDFKILAVNKPAERITNLTAKEMVGRKFKPNLINEKKFKTISQILFPSLAPFASQISGDSWPQITSLSLENPTLKLRMSLNRILDENKKTIGFLKIIKDETREKNILESKSEFIGIASHQLRTPLTALNWTLEHLSKNLGDKPELQEVAKEGLETSTKAIKTVNDLLDITRIEQGRFGYKFEKTDIAETLKEILKQARFAVEKRRIKIFFEQPQEPILANADSQRLGLAFSNLIDNAIRYNKTGGEISVLIERVTGRPFWKIIVSDTGVGIQTEELAKIFTKFYRGTNASQIEPDGNGLGLYIAKNIIESHGGKIEVVSNPGRGSVFQITIPAWAELNP